MLWKNLKFFQADEEGYWAYQKMRSCIEIFFNSVYPKTDGLPKYLPQTFDCAGPYYCRTTQVLSLMISRNSKYVWNLGTKIWFTRSSTRMRTDPDRSLNEDEAEKGEVEGSMVPESEKDQVFTMFTLIFNYLHYYYICKFYFFISNVPNPSSWYFSLYHY